MQEFIVTAQLCACNKCNAIMIDQNPDGQPKVSIDRDLLSTMIRHKELETDTDAEAFWACPNCLTNGFFVDVSGPDHLMTFLPPVQEGFFAKHFEITDIDQVRDFLYYCIFDLNLNFHADTPFEDYIDGNDNQLYSAANSDLLNDTLDRCFSVCQREHRDIHEITVEVSEKGQHIQSLKACQALLQRVLYRLNEIPNKQIRNGEDTYKIAADTSALLKELNRLQALN